MLDQLTLFAEDSPARTCQSQEKEKGYEMKTEIPRGADCGTRCSDWFGSADPLGYLLRMCVEQSTRPSMPCNPTFARKATKSGQSCFLLLRLARPTKEKGSSSSEQGRMWQGCANLWRTPDANCSRGAIIEGAVRLEEGNRDADIAERPGEARGMMWPTPKCGSNRNSRTAIIGGHPNHPSPSDLSLEQACEVVAGVLPKECHAPEELPKRFRELWPTPRANKVIATNEQAITRIEKSGYHANIEEAVAMSELWPTPSVCGNYNRRGASATSGDGLATAVKSTGQLNPDWTEILMGFPIGWTDIECDEPEPWPGWPAGMGTKPWRTPQASDGEHGGPNARDSAGGAHLSGQVLTISGQYPYEPPRTVTGMPNRAKRLKALGNSNPPQQYVPALMFIEIMRRMVE